MSKTTILVVEDDETVLSLMEHSLGNRGYEVITAETGEDALRIARDTQPNLILLDIMMPDMDGWEVCEQLRKSSTVPLIFITGLRSEEDVIRGLKMGADDYVMKPFSLDVLYARIDAVLRRATLGKYDDKAKRLLQVQDITIDQERYEVSQGETLLQLSRTEYELLRVLMMRAGTVVPRDELFRMVWKSDRTSDTRAVNVYIRHLRVKLNDDFSEPKYIDTVRGIGYRFIEGEKDKEEEVEEEETEETAQEQEEEQGQEA